MALPKNPKYDLRSKYSRVLKLGIIFSLMIIIVEFKYFPEVESKKIVLKAPQELIDVQDVDITKREAAPPPPPKPAIPIEAPSDNVLEDIEIQDTELDVNEQVTTPPPPQPVEEEDDETAEPVFFVAVEQMPVPIGGIEGIQKKIIYPEIAQRAAIQGRVYVKAYVDEQGNVSKVVLVKGIGAGCDEAAMAAVRQTQFLPGKQRGKPVKVQVTVPILFKLVNSSQAT